MQPLQYKATFLPDKNLLLTELIISAVLMAFGTFMVSINSYLASIGQITVQGSISQSFTYFQMSISSGGLAGRLTAAFFWAIIGMAMYMAYWAVHNVIANYHNHQVFQFSYVHPQISGKEVQIYHRVVGARVLHIGAIILMPLFVFVAVTSIYPGVLNLGVYFTNHVQEVSGWWALLAGYFTAFIMLHSGIVISRLGFSNYSVI